MRAHPRHTLSLFVAALPALLVLGACTAGELEGVARGVRLVGGGYAPFAASGPGSKLVFTSFPKQKSATDPGGWGPRLLDIEVHLPASYGSQYYADDKLTHAHETTHGINSHVRNYFNKTGKKANGFYLLDDHAVVIEEPSIKKSQVAAFIPASLRGYRFPTYITGQTAWDDEPLYIFDEWVAYVNGAVVGVDLVQRDTWNEQWTDGVSGALEFTIYALGLVRALEQHAPQYLASNTQFTEFLALHARRAMDTFRAGAQASAFTWVDQDQLYTKLRTHQDAAPLRATLVKLFGQVFADEVLLGSTAPSPDGSIPAPTDAGVLPHPPDGGGLVPPPPPPPPPLPDAGATKPDVGQPAPPPPPAPPGVDTTPPTVLITAPTSGATTGPSLVVAATITDDVALGRAELLLDGQLLAKRTTAPFEFAVQLASGKHTLRLLAYDTTGNRGEAAVTITVQSGAVPPGAAPSSPKGGFGATCNAPQQCASGVCAEDVAAKLRYCTERCQPQGANCPTGSACFAAMNAGVHVCGPPALPTIPSAPAAPPGGSHAALGGGLCAVAAQPTRDLPTALWALALLLGALAPRRRRSSRA